MAAGLKLSDGLTAKFNECIKELGLTDELTDAQYDTVAQYLVKNFPESLDLNNPADRLFQSLAGT